MPKSKAPPLYGGGPPGNHTLNKPAGETISSNRAGASVAFQLVTIISLRRPDLAVEASSE
jgi:hypothetical protein